RCIAWEGQSIRKTKCHLSSECGPDTDTIQPQEYRKAVAPGRMVPEVPCQLPRCVQRTALPLWIWIELYHFRLQKLKTEQFNLDSGWHPDRFGGGNQLGQL